MLPPLSMWEPTFPLHSGTIVWLVACSGMAELTTPKPLRNVGARASSPSALLPSYTSWTFVGC